jgi:RimJ/RimL family protein N-acetyltransferase
MKLLQPEDFKDLYTQQWSNALCETRKELDVLGIGAYDGGKLIGLAGCSADCETMWQIGVDVLPEYRKKGYGKGLFKALVQKAVDLNCGRMEWVCLNWNQPSIDFYLSLGAKPLDEWTTYRLTEADLKNLI